MERIADNQICVKISVSSDTRKTIEEVVYYRNRLPMAIVEKWRWYFEYLAARVKVRHPYRRVELVVVHQTLLQGQEYIEKKVKTMRCNAKRFSWRTVTEEQAKEEFLKEEAKRGAAELLHGFNFEEHMQIAFVPLIIIHCAWAYCDKVLQMAAKLRISETKKLGRAVKELKQAYYDELKKDLDYKHLKQVSDQAEEFMNTCAKDFMIMEFTIRGEILKVYPDDPYIDMRVYAFASVLLCDYYVKHSHECDKMIAARLHRRETQTMTNPKIDSLRTCMDAYTGTVEINLKQNVELCVRVFANNLKKINFTLDHEQRIGIQQ